MSSDNTSSKEDGTQEHDPIALALSGSRTAKESNAASESSDTQGLTRRKPFFSKLPLVRRLFKKDACDGLTGAQLEACQMSHFPIILQEVEKIYSKTLANGVSVLAITSSTKGEGVSLMVKTLALRNVLAGRRTLLLDFNFDRPMIASYVGMSSKGYVLGFGMSVLTLSANDSLVMRLREPGEFEARVKEWLTTYDTIIIDTSPLDTVSFSCFPAEISCAVADATVLMVLSARTTLALVAEAIEKLKNCQANLIGTVLNDNFNPGLKVELIRKFRWISKIIPPLSRWLENKIRYSRFLSLEI